MNQSKPRVSAFTTYGYALGDFGVNLYFISVMTWLLYFYTDVYGLSAAAASGVLFVARLIDAITDPLVGYVAERTRSRWGRMRPYLLFGGVPLALITVATFTVPGWDDAGKLVWAYVTYTVFGLVYTVVTIPYAALTGSITEDYAERTRLSTFRIGFAFAGGIISSVATFPLIKLFDSEAAGFQWVMAMYGVIATVLLWVTFASTREIAQKQTFPKPTLQQSWAAVTRNSHLWVVIAIFSCGALSFTVRQAMAPYYFIYNVGQPDLIATYFLATLGCMLIGVWLVPRLSARFGKDGAIRLGAYLTLLASVGFYLTPASAVSAVFVWGCLVALGATPVAVLGWAMIPDTVEYAQLKHGVRADGAIFATASFFQKLAKTIGGAGVAAILGWLGYVANTTQSEAALAGIHGMLTLGPLVLSVVLVALTHLYKLDRETHQQILDELAAR